MTDTEQPTLGEYRGKPVIMTSVAIIHAGDGLSESMSIDPEVYEPGARVFVLLETEVEDHAFKRIKKVPGSFNLLQRFTALTATVVPKEYAEEKIEAQRRLIQEYRDRKEGKLGLLSPEELTAAHEAGQHAEATVPNCPQCDDEVGAVAAEERIEQQAADAMESNGGPPVTPIAGRRARATRAQP